MKNKKHEDLEITITLKPAWEIFYSNGIYSLVQIYVKDFKGDGCLVFDGTDYNMYPNTDEIYFDYDSAIYEILKLQKSMLEFYKNLPPVDPITKIKEIEENIKKLEKL